MIEWVEVRNWRVYDLRRVDFGTGITFLMGANGAGKTSLLEAIAYGLTGEVNTLKDPRGLLRDPAKPAVVRLAFTLNGHHYEVERCQGCERAGSASLVLSDNGKRLATNHKTVTKRIEELMGVKADFLQRIVYMSEGDVFRFLDHSPVKTLDMQIRQVLGLTQLDRFVEALGAAEKEIKTRIADTQSLLDALSRYEGNDQILFERRLQQIEDQRHQLLSDLRECESVQTRQRRETEDVTRLMQFAVRGVAAFQRDAVTWNRTRRLPVILLFQQLEDEIHLAEDDLRALESSRARLEGERHGYERVLDLLRPYSDQAGTLPCPVCGKPMTLDERKTVIMDVQVAIRRIQDEFVAAEAALQHARTGLRTLQERQEALREVRNIITHVRFESLTETATLEDLLQIRNRSEINIPQETAAARLHEIETHLRDLERAQAEHTSLQSRLHLAGFTRPEEVTDELVQLETRALSLRAALAASEETLAQQRNDDIRAIYDQIARVYEAFGGGVKSWQLELSTDGGVQMEDSAGRQFDLSQFSGGEKTALMVMLHTIIAHHFSKTDFMLIDEPLEHLDAVNRRSLVKFLISAHKRGIFQQAIVATFEESLVRKYMSDEGIQVIHI